MSESGELSAQGRRALVAVLTGVALSTLDTAIANTALPAIAADLHSPAAASVWVINAYQLTVVATILPFAALGDLFSARRVFLWGIAFFTVASLLCAGAGSVLTLAIARAIQGFGAGAMMSVNIALIRQIYPAERLGRGVGFNALIVGLGFAVGPTVASLVLSVADWPWLFGINVPVGLLAGALGWAALPRSNAKAASFDPATAILTAVSFASLVFALTSVARLAPWQQIVPPAVMALLSGALLLKRQQGHPAPMLPVDLMARPMFALSALTAVAAFATQGLAFVSLPFFFEEVLHRNPIQTGVMMSFWPIFVAALAPVAGRLSDRYPPGLLGGIGLVMLSVGMAALALMPSNPSSMEIGIRLAICGAGFSFFQAPNLKAIMSSAPANRSGGASGVIGVARLLGQTSGAALVALCFHLAGLHGPVWALGFGAVTAGIAAVASLMRLTVDSPQRAQPQA